MHIKCSSLLCLGDSEIGYKRYVRTVMWYLIQARDLPVL